MRVLLPPSESKRPGGGSVAFSPETLAHPELSPARAAVIDALVALSADAEAAAQALKLGPSLRGEIDRNRQLRSSGTLPALDRYTGVLYDAIDAGSLDAQARAWLGERLLIQSAVFGLIGALDEIPAYRLSASSRLPGLTAPNGRAVSLKAHWKAAHAALDAPGLSASGPVLDLRSKDYVALHPGTLGDEAAFLNVVGRDADGVLRPLNHFNKAGKGRLVRELALDRPELSSLTDFLGWAEARGHGVAHTEAGIDIEISADPLG